MLEDIDKDAVDFKLNYDESMEEPATLPSKFPYLLCGNNSGIAVGMSSDLVSHNFTEVCGAIEYYMQHKDCSIADLMVYIKGPDFPTGGKIINGEDLLNIYSTGRGAVKVCAHYDIVKKGQKTLIIFHDIPYGIDIDSGVKTPLKKMVLDDGYDIFEDIDIKKAGPRNFDITITLGKNADVGKCLELLFTKTGLSDSIKINQTVIVDGEPQLLNLKQLVEYWVNYRSNVIKRISKNDYEKTNHKLTITLGLQKCMSDIDKLVSLIRTSDSRAAAKIAIMKEFELNEEQADAVLDMKLSKLSRLDLTELNDTETQLRKTLARLKDIIDNETTRYEIILSDLKEIKKILGEDKRLTEIYYSTPVAGLNENHQPKTLVKQEWLVYSDGLKTIQIGASGMNAAENGLLDVIYAYSPAEIFGYNKEGEMSPITSPCTPLIRGGLKGKSKLVAVTKNGNIKVTDCNEYKWTKNREKILKLKDGDELIFADTCDDDDYVIIFSKNENKVLKLAIKNLPLASKSTVGVKSGFTEVTSADVVKDCDILLSVTKDNKGKLTPVNGLSIDNRGNKGQSLAADTVVLKKYDDSRDCFYAIPKTGKPITVSRDKITIKSKTAVGASISARELINVI